MKTCASTIPSSLITPSTVHVPCINNSTSINVDEQKKSAFADLTSDEFCDNNSTVCNCSSASTLDESLTTDNLIKNSSNNESTIILDTLDQSHTNESIDFVVRVCSGVCKPSMRSNVSNDISADNLKLLYTANMKLLHSQSLNVIKEKLVIDDIISSTENIEYSVSSNSIIPSKVIGIHILFHIAEFLCLK